MEDLQGLLEKINRDGVEKAEAAAKEIVSKAEAKAAAILKEAEAESARRLKAAEAEAESFVKRSEVTLKQAARDVVLEVRDSLSAKFDELLVKSVDRTLADEATLVSLVEGAVRSLTGPGEISVSPKLVAALQAKLASAEFTVLADEAVGGGFAVRVDKGRVEHAFTVEAIAGELSKRLRPELAKLLN